MSDEAKPWDTRVAQLEEALRRVAVGKHYQEDYPDHPIHWSAKLTCTRCDAYGEDIDHLDRRHAIDCPVRLARAALSTSPSDWLAEHDRSIAERQREACAKAAALAPSCEIHEHGPCEWDGACDAIAELVRATPLVTK